MNLNGKFKRVAVIPKCRDVVRVLPLEHKALLINMLAGLFLLFIIQIWD